MMNLTCSIVASATVFYSILVGAGSVTGQEAQNATRIVDRIERIRSRTAVPAQHHSTTADTATTQIDQPQTVKTEPIVRLIAPVPDVDPSAFGAPSEVFPVQESRRQSIPVSSSRFNERTARGRTGVTWLTAEPGRQVPSSPNSIPRIEDNATLIPPPQDQEQEFDPQNEPQQPNDRPGLQQEPTNQWPRRTILETRVDIRDFSQIRPADRSAELIGKRQSDWNSFFPPESIFTWAAPNICYQPLYYEDVALERYGQSACCLRQSALSAVHFFASTVLIPYSMWQDPPHSCQYPLGYCRPGDPVPRIYQKHFWGLHR